LYNCIREESIVMDELVEKTQMSVQQIADLLLMLQLKKLIKQLPGKQFVRSNEA